MLHTQIAALALAATALAVSGCGGSSKTVSTTTAAAVSTTATTSTATTGTATTSTPATTAAGKPLTRTELIAKTDAICARITAKRSSTKFTEAKDYAHLVPPLAAYEQAEAAELIKLTPPASMAGEWKQIASRVQTVANDTATIGHDILTNQDSAGGALLTKTTAILVQMNAIAKRDGFTSCAQF
jgi:hypothetical protein